MRVGLDISNVIDPRPSGVARYILHLWRALRALPDGPEIRLYCRPSRLRRGRPRDWFPDEKIHWLHGLTAPRGIDLFHAPDLRAPRKLACPLVVTIHDLCSLRRSDHASTEFVEQKRQGYQHAARTAALILTHTQAVRTEIHEQLGVPETAVVAVPLADPLPTGPGTTRPETHGGRNAEELLVVGGPSVRKGSARIVPLLLHWARAGWKPRVIWVGSTPEGEARTFFDGLPAPARDAIDYRGHVSDEELARLYETTTGLIQLSDAEGFGIPLLEAAQRDCAVISLDCPPLRETLGEAAFWFREAEASAPEIAREFRNPERRQQIVSAARERSREFTWRRTAQETLAAYERALQRP